MGPNPGVAKVDREDRNRFNTKLTPLPPSFPSLALTHTHTHTHTHYLSLSLLLTSISLVKQVMYISNKLTRGKNKRGTDLKHCQKILENEIWLI